MDKLSNGLAKLAEEDPTFTVKTDEQTGQTVISGMGELHLDIIIDRLKREFKVECNQGKPQVNYKEAITKTVNLREVYKKQSGGRGKFADIIVQLLLHVQDGALDLQQGIVDGLGALQVLVLGQIAHGGAFGHGHTALVGPQLADDDFQQGGLAGPVDADHGRLLVLLYVKGYMF